MSAFRHRIFPVSARQPFRSLGEEERPELVIPLSSCKALEHFAIDTSSACHCSNCLNRVPTFRSTKTILVTPDYRELIHLHEIKCSFARY